MNNNQDSPFTDLRQMWREADKKAKDWRTAGEKTLLAQMIDAYHGLTECGWRRIDSAPKDGTKFLCIEAGSSGVFECHYQGEWPKGLFWVSSDGDLWPSRPILWKPIKSVL